MSKNLQNMEPILPIWNLFMIGSPRFHRLNQGKKGWRSTDPYTYTGYWVIILYLYWILGDNITYKS